MLLNLNSSMKCERRLSTGIVSRLMSFFNISRKIHVVGPSSGPKEKKLFILYFWLSNLISTKHRMIFYWWSFSEPIKISKFKIYLNSFSNSSSGIDDSKKPLFILPPTFFIFEFDFSKKVFFIISSKVSFIF